MYILCSAVQCSVAEADDQSDVVTCCLQSKQSLFTQAIDEDSSAAGRKFDLQIDCTQITFRFRYVSVTV